MSEALRPAPLVLAWPLELLHDPAIRSARSVAALCGQDVPVILSPRCCDPLYRKSLRVSMGHALTIPFFQVQEQSQWIPTLTTIKESAFNLLALTPASDAIDIEEIPKNTTHSLKNALMLGAEGPGLTNSALNAAHKKVRIPLVSSADSLNISVAAAVALHRLIPPSE